MADTKLTLGVDVGLEAAQTKLRAFYAEWEAKTLKLSADMANLGGGNVPGKTFGGLSAASGPMPTAILQPRSAAVPAQPVQPGDLSGMMQSRWVGGAGFSNPSGGLGGLGVGSAPFSSIPSSAATNSVFGDTSRLLPGGSFSAVASALASQSSTGLVRSTRGNDAGGYGSFYRGPSSYRAGFAGDDVFEGEVVGSRMLPGPIPAAGGGARRTRGFGFPSMPSRPAAWNDGGGDPSEADLNAWRATLTDGQGPPRQRGGRVPRPTSLSQALGQSSGVFGRFGAALIGGSVFYAAARTVGYGLDAIEQYQQSGIDEMLAGGDQRSAYDRALKRSDYAYNAPFGIGTVARIANVDARAGQAYTSRQFDLSDEAAAGNSSFSSLRTSVTRQAGIAAAGLLGQFAQAYEASRLGAESQIGEAVKARNDATAPLVEARKIARTRIASLQADLDNPLRSVSNVVSGTKTDLATAQRDEASLTSKITALDTALNNTSSVINTTAAINQRGITAQRAATLTGIFGSTQAAGFAGANLPLQATLAGIDAQTSSVMSTYQIAGGDRDVYRAQLSNLSATRNAAIAGYNREVGAAVTGLNGQTEASRLAIAGYSLQGSLAQIKANTSATLQGTPGWAEYQQDPNFAGTVNRSRIDAIMENGQAQQEAARVGYERQQIALVGQTRSTNLAASFQPLQAQLSGLDSNFAAATYAMAPGSEQYGRLRNQLTADRRLAEIGFGVQTESIGIGLSTQRLAQEAALQRDFVGAQAISTSGNAIGDALGLFTSGRKGLARERLANGIGDLRVQAGNYGDSFQAGQFDAFNLTLDNPRDAQNPQTVFDTFNREAGKLERLSRAENKDFVGQAAKESGASGYTDVAQTVSRIEQLLQILVGGP